MTRNAINFSNKIKFNPRMRLDTIKYGFLVVSTRWLSNAETVAWTHSRWTTKRRVIDVPNDAGIKHRWSNFAWLISVVIREFLYFFRDSDESRKVMQTTESYSFRLLFFRATPAWLVHLIMSLSAASTEQHICCTHGTDAYEHSFDGECKKYEYIDDGLWRSVKNAFLSCVLRLCGSSNWMWRLFSRCIFH